VARYAFAALAVLAPQLLAPCEAQTAGAGQAEGQHWLCRPGASDACAVDMSTTIVGGDGTLTPEGWSADPDAPVDCFYVYPTVSTDRTTYSDLTPDPAELNVVRTQFARFASKCRLYAPLYRQVTLGAVARGLKSGSLVPPDRGPGYEDVRDAWHAYLAHDNHGRGVVLIGHSQGAYVLMELIRREIDGKPVQSRLVSAILAGANVPVARGRDVGGAFQHIPLCRSAAQTGCVIAYASFRSTAPPSSDALFGRVADEDQAAACTNPASLAGGSGALHVYLASTGRTIIGRAAPKPWVTPPQPIETPWVSLPGMLTARCASNEHASGYLEVTVHGDPADHRVDDIGGDADGGGSRWGLHLVDINLAMGNLLDIIGEQTRAYLASQR
jgi:hypothetical protein